MGPRRLAVLMFTDMVGYSAIAHANEILARALVSEQRTIIRSALVVHHGRERDTTGDGFFIEFASAVEAMNCAVEIQSQLFDRNRSASQDRQIVLRIGLHLGDIVTDGSDLFGSGVNLAARIEPLAPRGGICITQQVFDQVDGKIPGLTYKKRGRHELKNIASGAVLYSVITPWNRPERKQLSSFATFLKSAAYWPIFENINSISSAGLFAVCLLLLVASSYRAYMFDSSQELNATTRGPASVQHVADQPVDLSQGWLFQTSENSSRTVELQEPPAGGWKPFDPQNSWQYSESLRGHYWLKKSFEMNSLIKTPAIVLGLISGKHRVYLNGKFIGGGENPTELSYYTFAPDDLNIGRANEILVAVDGSPSLNPGLSKVAAIGTYLGDFRDVRDSVDRNQVKFGVLRTVFFSISVFIFAVALAYAFFRRSSKAYFYHAFVLLLGSIELAYFSPLMNVAFDYPFLRFLRVIGLALTPVILFSSYLSSDGQRRSIRFEALNNLFAAIFACIIGFVLFRASPTAEQFTKNFNTLLFMGIVYSILACAAIVVSSGARVMNKALSRSRAVTATFYFVFEVAALLLLVASLKRGLGSTLLSVSVRETVIRFNLAVPFLFALAVTAVATADHIRQSALTRFQKRRDNFAREVLHLIHDAENPIRASEILHHKLSSFIEATRSTLYLVEQKDNVQSLRIIGCVGRQLANGNLAATSLSSHRILHHVYQTKTPLFIRDVSEDLRFVAQKKKVEATSDYRTSSCMVLPLRSMGMCVGLLTFADKSEGAAFSENDFAMALEMSSTLAMLVKLKTDFSANLLIKGQTEAI